MPLLALVVVTALWGITFVQVKDAVELYPLFAFLAVRFAIAIVLMERFAPRFDALAFTLVEMGAAFAGLLVVSLALGDLGVPHWWTVWGAGGPHSGKR